MSDHMLTNHGKLRRHLTSNGVYTVCGMAIEIIFHAFRDCIIARQVWYRMLPKSYCAKFFLSDIRP